VKSKCVTPFQTERVGEPLKESELMWGIFKLTGNVDAYLIYLDCIQAERDLPGSSELQGGQ